MTCTDCDGEGTGGKPGTTCFRCDGSGSLCDVCGEATDSGQDVCDDCQEERNARESES